MQIDITATAFLVTIDGVRCRKWIGRTKGGVPVAVYVHHMQPISLLDAQMFEAEVIYAMPDALPPADMTLSDLFVKPVARKRKAGTQ